MFSLEQNTYKNARLGDTDFTDAELRGYTFENCDLRGAMFSGALLEKCRFSACAFDFSRLNDVLANFGSTEAAPIILPSLFSVTISVILPWDSGPSRAVMETASGCIELSMSPVLTAHSRTVDSFFPHPFVAGLTITI